MKEINRYIRLIEHENDSQLAPEVRALLASAVEATALSYAPYSDFHVGAAIRLEDGTVLLGCNQENAAFPSGLCAERVAFFAAGVQHKDKRIDALAITIRSASKADAEPAAPCGGCLQVMSDVEKRQGSPIRIYLQGNSAPVIEAESVSSFLPFGFSLVGK